MLNKNGKTSLFAVFRSVFGVFSGRWLLSDIDCDIMLLYQDNTIAVKRDYVSKKGVLP